MKLPQLRFKLNIKPILNYIVVVVCTAVFLATLFMALPLTEKFLKNSSYNLNPKSEMYWSKEYVLTLDTQDSKIVEGTRDIIYKRLNKFDVEEFSTYVEDTNKIRIVITSAKKKDLVEELLKNRFDIQIVTRKDDFNYEDTKDPYAYLLASNYNPTDWSRSDFRNVYITNLRNSSGTYSNFAIYKLWPTAEKKFKDFLKTYTGKTIGISIDGYVTPHQVSTDYSVFAVPVATEDKASLRVVDILYNTGVIGTNFSVTSQTDLNVNIPQVDYIKMTIGIFVGLLLLYIYLFISKQTHSYVLTKSLISTALTISIYLAFLKIFKIPVDTFLLPIEAIAVIILARVLAENKDSIFYLEIILFSVLAVMIFLGNGFVSILAQDLLILGTLTKISLIISGWYIDKVKKI